MSINIPEDIESMHQSILDYFTRVPQSGIVRGIDCGELTEEQETVRQMINESVRRRIEIEQAPGGILYKKPHPINNPSCKFYTDNPYLRCAVNPAGQCEGCNDCEE